MLRVWPLFFFIIPLVEIYFLVQVGEQIGAWKTVLLVIVTAVIGVTLLRHQGIKTLLRMNQTIQAGQIPAKEIFDGVVLAVVGILLITPGFFTDAIGFILLVPVMRQVLLGRLLRKLVNPARFSQSSAQFSSRQYSESSQQPDDKDKAGSHRTLDGEFKRDD